MAEESATLVEAAKVPNDIYIGTNVVHRHIFEFFDLATNQLLLGEGEQVLAVFDCVILDETGRRLGGLTLHDYVVLTDKNLITWGRGRSKDVIDKFGWPNIALDRFGRRTPIEGVIKVLYKSRPTGNGRKRRISVRPNRETSVSNPDDKIRPATLTGGVSLYLDLMPAGDVRPCVEMMRYLMGVSAGAPSGEGFHDHFRPNILESQHRVAQVALLFQPFYVDAGNGVLIERDAEEERVYRSVPRHITAQAERIRPASPINPYQNGRRANQRGVSSPYRGSNQARANRMPMRNPDVVVSMDVADAPSSSNSLNRGNRRTTTGAPRKMVSELAMSSNTVSLNNQGFGGQSKLEAYDRRVTGGGGSRLERVPAARPEPALRAASLPPAPRPDPVARPVPPLPSQSRERIRPANDAGGTARRSGSFNPPVVERLVSEQANFNRPLSMPIGLAIPKLAFNVYNVSRLARGLWIQPQNLGRNVGDLSETLGVVGDVIGLLATDAETRRMAINRLKYAVDRGPLARNLILHYTIWPFIKPIIDWVALPGSYADAQVYNRVTVRGGNIDEAMNEMVGDPDLPDMGVVSGSDKPISPAMSPSNPVPVAVKPTPMPRVTPSVPMPPVPMPRVTPSVPVPPVPMPRVQPNPPEPARQTIAPKPKPPTEPSPVKRQPIGDLAMGVVSPAEVRPSKDDLGNQATTWPTPPPSPPANDVTQQFTLPKPPIPASKLGNELEITAQEMQDTPAPDKGADNPPPPAKSKLGQDL